MVGEWLVEPDLDRLVRNGEIVTTEPRVMSVLVYLAGHAGEVVSSDELVDTVWHGGAVGPGTIYQNIAQLRKLLGDDADDPLYISTIPRKGYRLIAAVKPCTEEPADVLAGSPTDKRLRPGYRLLAIIAVVLLIALAAFEYRWISTPPAELPRVAIAVLPFADLSEDGQNEYFCDGLSEELLNGLSRIPDLHIAARTQLRVTHILEGSVRKSDSHVRITAQLIDVRSGFHLWTGTYERSLDDVFVIQEEISRAVVDALEIRLAGDTEERLAQFPTGDINAYDFYLLGRHRWHQRTGDSLNQAIGYFQRAIEIDAGFALAYTGLADSYTAMVYYGTSSLQEATSKALPNIVQALKIDNQLAEAHASLGLLRKDHGDYAAADVSLQEAIRLNPNYALAHLWYGISLHEQGELRRALASYQRAVDLDPLSFFVNIRIGVTQLIMGHFDDSLAHYYKGIELAPEHPNGYWGVGLVALEQGRLDDAVRWYEKALSLDPDRAEILLQLGWVYLDLGDYEKAGHVFDRVADLGPADDYLKLPKGWWYIAHGEYEKLLRFANEGVLLPPNDAGILANGGFYEMLAENFDSALDYYQRALDDSEIGEDLLYMVWDLHWGTSHGANLANIYFQLGMAQDGQALVTNTLNFIEHRRTRGAVEHGAYYIQASVHALAGETDKALSALEKAVQLGWRRAWWAERDPSLSSLRGKPRFERLLAQVRTETTMMRTRLTQSAETGRLTN
jgi:TolB-like protein/DNA-binding winged helix-turn-helix (wHTH) protein/Tfp pilus assembly protein PilF